MSGTLPVLLDATSLPPTKGGVARYLAGLLSGLTDAGVRIHVVVKADDLGWISEQAPEHDYVEGPRALSIRPVRLLWEQFGLPRLAARLGVETLHSPHYTFPLRYSGRRVVTVHDATFFSRPADHGRLKRIFFTTWIRLGGRRADVVVTPSQATADEMVRFTGAPRGEVRVALHGVDPQVFRTPSADAVARFASRLRIDTGRGWIAFLGTVEPRKNVVPLLEAHALLSRQRDDVPPLLVAGGLGWDDEARTRLLEAGNLPGAPVRYLGYVDLADLSAFLGGSTLVAYPSSAEGFGLPVLEAMSAGATVLTTRRLAIPEVGGDAVAYAEPTPNALADGIARLVDSPETRLRLSVEAAARATLFTWEACAEIHVLAYRAT